MRGGRIHVRRALLASTCQGALHDGRDNDLQHRAPITIFGGLRPQPARERHPKKPATSLHI